MKEFVQNFLGKSDKKPSEKSGEKPKPKAPVQTGQGVSSAPKKKPPFRRPPPPPKSGVHAPKSVLRTPDKHNGLRAYIIGGLNEVGKNCLALECNDDIIVIDVGLAFPDDEMLGVDFVIPDTSFLEKNKHRIRGFILTHGHLDHIGALQHVLPKVGFPLMVCTNLTKGLIEKRVEEGGVAKQCRYQVVDPMKDTIKLGCFELEFFPVNHSIPDCMGVFGKTPGGTFVHTGDFKFDFTPADGQSADISRMAEISKKGVDVIFCESTNAPKKGFCKSEKIIGENLHEVISEAKGRIILASFSSLISRIEQIVHFAAKYNRKVFISGRSMQNTLEIAAKAGFFKVPKGSLRRLSPAVDDLPPNQVLILTTGSQGEPRSALTRIGMGTHTQITIKKGDSVVFSSSPIPGNERGVYSSINNLIRMGAKVITNDTLDIHVSGHGHEGDIKLMHNIMKAKNIIPIHGEMFMRQAHQKIAFDLGYAPENVPLLENGVILDFDKATGHIRRSKSRIPCDMILVDGLGAGDVGTRIMEERKVMANGGVIFAVIKVMDKSKRMIGEPQITAKGFVYMSEGNEILRECKIQAKKSYEQALKETTDIKDLKKKVLRGLQTLIYKRIQREPMIIPHIVMV